MTAAQEQALRTNYRRARIEKDGKSPKFTVCKGHDETVWHIVSACPKLQATSSDKFRQVQTSSDMINLLRLCTGIMQETPVATHPAPVQASARKCD